MKLPSLALAVALAACTADEAEVAPPRFGFYYPTGITMDGPEERFLFVSSANADLRYAAGTLQTVDLDAVKVVTDAWAAGDRGACTPSASAPRTLICPTEVDGTRASFMVEQGAAQIGNFAVDVGVQRLASGLIRVFTTVRGDPSITWMDFDAAGKMLDCGESTSSFPRCAESHRLDVIRKDETLGTLISEPFYLYVDGQAEHVFVTHLTAGAVSLAVAPLDGSEPYISDLEGNIFAPNAQGAIGATGIIGLEPGTPGGLVYVASPREARVAMIRVVEGAPTEEGLKNEVLVRVPDYILVDNLSVGDRNDARALALGAGGTRLYVVNRLTPQILVYDVTRDASGAPRNQLLSRVEICAQAATMAVADMGKGERIYVPCFSNGQVWVVDPGRGRLEAIIESGRGPNAAVAASSVATDRKQVYVTNYAEDTISVIDARPGSPTENYVVMKIGVPRDTTLPVGAVSQRSLP